MGRKEGGSLFHQFITTPGLYIRADRTDRNGNEMPVSFRTHTNYNTWLHRAADYFKAKGIRSKDQIDKDMVQEYADELLAKGLSASTIHSYLTPLCKVTGVKLEEIEKPIRYASEFIRSGGGGKAEGGRSAELNAMIGIREDELRHLCGNDICEKKGVTYVIIRRGKGGRYQEQKVLPEHVMAVRRFFDGTDKKLFRADEFVSGFDYHGQRRAHAAEMLEYYSICSPTGKSPAAGVYRCV